jgi:Fe-S cluster assembly iron-binding protein IscA
MVKGTDGYDVKVPQQGQVTYNSVAGSLGLASFLGLNANNILGGCGGGLFGNRVGGCSPADQPVTRYELGMEQALAAKDSEIALLKANTYQDQKSLELYRYIDGKFNEINAALAAQAVTNTAFNSSMQAMDYKFTQQVALEAERRQCADCKIVNYVNSTFTPKLITDYTAGTTSAAAQVYNPLACGQCGCGVQQ